MLFYFPDAIPEPPLIPDASAEALSNLNALGEATFESLGLGGWTPVGIVQQCMEFLHVNFGIDWWLAIVIGEFLNCLPNKCNHNIKIKKYRDNSFPSNPILAKWQVSNERF